jgi:hypothetical protein
MISGKLKPLAVLFLSSPLMGNGMKLRAAVVLPPRER